MKDLRKTIAEEFPEFHAEVSSLSADQLDSRLAQLAKDESEVNKAKEEDEQLHTAREQLKEFSAPYREAKKAIKSKVAFIIELLKDRGQQ